MTFMTFMTASYDALMTKEKYNCIYTEKDKWLMRII
jgi:hypothetical protein